MTQVVPTPRRRRLWKASAALLLLLGLFLLLLPTLLSTRPGTRLALSLAERSIDGSIALDDLSVGWFSETRVAGLTVTDAQGQTLLTVAHLALPDKSLLGLLGSTQSLGRVTADRIDLRLVRYDDGSTNLDRLLKSSPDASPRREASTRSQTPAADPMELAADVRLSQLVVSLTAPDLEPVRLDAPTIHARLDGLRRIDLDLDITVTQGEHTGRLTATGGLSDPAGPAPTADLDAQLRQLPLAAVDQLLGYDGRLAALLGDRLDADLSLTGTPDNADLRLTARSPRLNVVLPAHLSAQALRADAGGHAQFTVTPQALAAQNPDHSPAALLDPVTLTIDVTELNLPLSDGKPLPRQLRAALALRTDALRLQQESMGQVTLTDLEGDATLDLAAGSFDAKLIGPFTLNDQTGTLNLTASLAGLNDPAARSLDVTVTDLPVPVVDQLANLDGRAVAALGGAATLTAKGTYPGDLTIRLRGDHTTLDAPLTLTDADWSLRSPATLHTELSPDHYAKLIGSETGGRLTDPLVLDVQVRRFVLPLRDRQPDWTRLRATLDARTNIVTLDLPGVGLTRLDGLQLSLDTDRATDTATLAADAPVTVAAVPGTLDVDLTLHSTADGPPYDITGTITDLPMPLVDHLARLDGDATGLVGPTATLHVAGQFPGATLCTLDSRSVHAAAPAHVDEAGRLTLTQDFTVEVSLEDEGTRRVMARLHPIIADAVRSEKPMKLLVRSEGFAMPLRRFTFDQLRAKGTLDLGTLRMTRTGWFDTFLSKAMNKVGLGALADSETYTAAFTPADFVVVDGQVRSGELWMTTDEMAVGFRGRADTVKRIYDFELGLMGATLLSKVRQIPGLEKYADFIPAADILTIPLSGGFDRPTPDLGRMIGELGPYVLRASGTELNDDAQKGIDLLTGLLRGTKRKNSPAVAWSPPPAAAALAATFAPRLPDKRRDKTADPSNDPSTDKTTDEAADEARKHRRQAEKRAEKQRREAQQRQAESEAAAAQRRREAQQRRQEQQQQQQQQRQQQQEEP